MGRFSVRTSVRSYVRTYVPPSGPSSQAWGPASQAWGPASHAWSLRPGWLSGPQAWLAGPQAWLDGPKGGQTYKWTENLPIPQDFAPYQGRCPKRKTFSRCLQEAVDKLLQNSLRCMATIIILPNQFFPYRLECIYRKNFLFQDNSCYFLQMPLKQLTSCSSTL